MELFVSEHLTGQVRSMLSLESEDEDLNSAMEIYKTRIEKEQVEGVEAARRDRKRVLKPQPSTWDSEFDGSWEDEPDAWAYEDEPEVSLAAPPTRDTAKGRGKAARKEVDAMDEDVEEPAPAKKPVAKRATRTAKAAPAKKPAARGRGRKAFQDSEEEEEDDVVMESEEEVAPVPAPKTRRGQPARSTTKATTTRGAAKARQTTLDFSQSQKKSGTQSKAVEISDDEISDDDEAFEPVPATRTRRKKV